MRSARLGMLGTMSVKCHTWADIKARIKPEVTTWIEAEAHHLSDGLRSKAEPQTSYTEDVGRRRRCKPARDD